MHFCGACMPRRHEPRGIVARKRIAELTAQHAGPTKPAPARSRSRRRGRCWRTPTARCSHRGSRSTDRRQTRHLRQTTLGANDLWSKAVALWLPRVSLVGGSALSRPRAKPSRAATQRTLQREKGVVVDGADLLQQQYDMVQHSTRSCTAVATQPDDDFYFYFFRAIGHARQSCRRGRRA